MMSVKAEQLLFPSSKGSYTVDMDKFQAHRLNKVNIVR